jgi:hypothetical protein
VVADIGTVFADEDPKVVYHFPVKNLSDQPAKIIGVTASCGCMKAEVEKYSLAPWEETKVVLQMDFRSRSGSQNIACQIHFESGEVRRFLLKATVHRHAVFQPDALHYGVVDDSECVQKRVAFIATVPRGVVPPQLLCVNPDARNISVERREPLIEDLGTAMRYHHNLVLTLLPDTAPGQEQCRITARYSWKGREQEAVLWATWRVRRHVEVTPERVFIGGESGTEDRVKRTITLRSAPNEEFAVQAVKTTDERIVCMTKLNARTSSHILDLTVSRATNQEDLIGEVVLTTDHPRQKAIRIPVTALAIRQTANPW